MTACSPAFPIRVIWACVCLLGIGCSTTGISRDLPLPSPPPFSASGQAEPLERWWRALGDPGLNFYVEQALERNFDLAAALQRLRAARAITRREASDLFPDLDGIVGVETTFGPGPTTTRSTWGLDAAYQVDLWGQIQSRVDAERIRAQATQSDYHAVALTLSAEVARTWFSLMETHAQWALLEQQLETNRTGLKDQNLRFGFGDEGGLPDVLRQEQLVQATLEQIVVVQARVEVLEHRLAVLIGQPPQTARYDTGAELPDLPPPPDVGLPEELLMRRPDVRADFLAMRAADRDYAAALSARYPRLNLTGSLVNSATSSDNLFRDWFLAVGGQLIAPLLDGGQRCAEIERTLAERTQRNQELGQTMLIAFQEVEDGLARERYQMERIERLYAQESLAGRAANQLKQRFFLQSATFLDFLSATQSHQRLQRDVLSARLERILIRIGLHLAIAGDFDTRPQQAPVDEPSLPALREDERAGDDPGLPLGQPPGEVHRLPQDPLRDTDE